MSGSFIYNIFNFFEAVETSKMRKTEKALREQLHKFPLGMMEL